jgi:hypothetical protein
VGPGAEAGTEARRHILEIRRHGGSPACGAGGAGGGTEALSACETYERGRGVVNQSVVSLRLAKTDSAGPQPQSGSSITTIGSGK